MEEIAAAKLALWRLLKTAIEQRKEELDLELFIELTIDLHKSGDLD